jgi:hypothetical protein
MADVLEWLRLIQSGSWWTSNSLEIDICFLTSRATPNSCFQVADCGQASNADFNRSKTASSLENSLAS